MILSKIQLYIFTGANQFSYKKQVGTDMCLVIFKEILHSYKKFNSSIFCRFLDVKGAFHMVNHRTLFNILIEHGVHIVFVRILAFWYRHQTMCIRWGNTLSSPFTVTGSKLPLIFLNVYVDKISVKLNNYPISCNVNNGCYCKSSLLCR